MAKTIVVTGSTSGIGYGIAKAFAEDGYNVAINSHEDTNENRKLAQDLASATGSKVIFVKADMSKADDCEALIKTAYQELGSVDILVNNAGIQHVAAIENFPPEKWNAIIAINLTSAFHTMRHTVPLMKKAGWGRIINIASAHGLRASPFKSAYIASKHGIVGMTKSVALELAREKITVNAICPGYVKTPLVEGQIPDQMKEHNMSREEVIEKVLLAKQPSKEFATVEEIAGTTQFLCSDAAAQITGTTISIDGGWTAQ
jgi:3-hydroxybutyrate dehydrogenase